MPSSRTSSAAPSPSSGPRRRTPASRSSVRSFPAHASSSSNRWRRKMSRRSAPARCGTGSADSETAASPSTRTPWPGSGSRRTGMPAAPSTRSRRRRIWPAWTVSPRSRRVTWRPRCRNGSPATTSRARSTSTSSPPCTRPCAGRTWTRRSTGSRGCWTAARIPCTWPGASCAWPPRMSDSRIPARWRSRSRRGTRTTFSAAPKEIWPWPRRSPTWPSPRSRTPSTGRSAPLPGRRAKRRPTPSRSIFETRPRGS